MPKKPQVISEAEESKGQPAGVAVDDRAHPQRLLVLADDTASFFKLQGESELIPDTSLPSFRNAKLARFAPQSGEQAAIVDEQGIHIVSMALGGSLFLDLPNIDAFKYSPADNYMVTCEKYNANTPDYQNLSIIDISKGSKVAQFVWRKPAKEGLRTLMWSPDESICLRMAPPEGPGQPNLVEVYRNNDFSAPAHTILARFPVKGKNKKDPPAFVNGKFDGFALCPLNSAVSPEESPQYLFAWQNAAKMSEEDTNGTVFVYDLKADSFERSKFMIQCHQGQEINVKTNCNGYATLIWSQNMSDTSGKSYYGEHMLQYVQVFGGRDRQHVPVFQNMIQDVEWLATGERFIVIAGN